MVGVPSSRGCEACRRQKKKCDQQKPSCSRCSHLKIDCTGSGQQRYKFQEQNSIHPTTSTKPTQGLQSRQIVILPSLTTANMAITNAWIDALRVTNPGFNLDCFGGILFPQIPRRVGQNEALDASVLALASSFSSMHTPQKRPEAQAKYGQALRALRVCLLDPIKATSSDTLCAVWFLLICQDWIARQDFKHGDHYEGLSLVLNAVAPLQDWTNPFDVGVISVASMIVIIDSVTNPKARLGPWFQRFAETYGPRRHSAIDVGSMFQTLRLGSMVKIAKYIRDPGPNRLAIQFAYRDTRADILCVKERIAQLESPDTLIPIHGKLTPVEHTKLKFRYLTAYGMMIQFSTILNYYLRAFGPPEDHLNELYEDSLLFADELLSISRMAAPFRPLGASFMGQALCAAWATTPDPTRQAKIEKMIKNYETDLPNASYMPSARWASGQLESWREKFSQAQNVDPQSLCEISTITEEDVQDGSRGRSCCIM